VLRVSATVWRFCLFVRHFYTAQSRTKRRDGQLCAADNLKAFLRG
jgi:hypothetical protein